MAWVGVVVLALHFLFGQANWAQRTNQKLKWAALVIGGLQATLAAWAMMQGPQAAKDLKQTQAQSGLPQIPPEGILILGLLGVAAFFLVAKEEDRRKTES